MNITYLENYEQLFARTSTATKVGIMKLNEGADCTFFDISVVADNTLKFPVCHLCKKRDTAT